MTWFAAGVAAMLWPYRDPLFFALLLPVPVLFSAVTVAIVTTGWARQARAIGWAVCGYLLGLAVRQPVRCAERAVRCLATRGLRRERRRPRLRCPGNDPVQRFVTPAHPVGV